MFSYFTVHLAVVSLATVVCFLRVPHDADVQFEDEVFINVKEGIRTRRSVDDKFHPKTYEFDLAVNGSNLHVHLKRNDQLKIDVPTIILRQEHFESRILKDTEESVFYQDTINGAVFVVQEDGTKTKNMFGVFHAGGEEYILQTPEVNKSASFGEGYNRFQIFKEKHQHILFSDLLRREITESKKPVPKDAYHRQKRAAGSYQIELLIVVDFSIYQYWYDKSTKPSSAEKETDALMTVRQFYAFVVNGMDAQYKNIQTSSYTLSIVFAGIIIAQTPSDSTWTESIVVTSTSPYQVDSSNALGNFRTWIQSQANLPGHDHAMLFTRYDLTSSGSTSNAGLAYVGQVCATSSQSIVEDHFNFVLLTVASHELGHSLSASHDSEGNTCSGSDSYIMASSSSPQTGSTAVNPWKFSSCSTNYFTAYIDSLEVNGANCMASLSPEFNTSALSEYADDMPGQVYDTDAQCENIQGPGSYFCKDRYSGDFSSICTTLWCAIPTNPGYCSTSVAADGTLCGDKQWCISGVCTCDPEAPSGQSSCLYGDQTGQIYSNQPWTCTDIADSYSYNCPSVSMKCCNACAPHLPPAATTMPCTPGNTSTLASGISTTVPVSPTSGSLATTHVSTTTVTNQLSDIDTQCENALGVGSVMCRGQYGGDFTSVCSTLWCSKPTNISICQSTTASDGTLCGSQKWCLSGVCSADSSAPTGDDSCLYGDQLGPIFSNGWTCADMMVNAPSYCPHVHIACCGSCNPSTTSTSSTVMITSTTVQTPSTTLTDSATTMAPTTNNISQPPDADAQCESNLGAGSFMCRGQYGGDFTSICTTLWCAKPTNTSICQSATATDGTVCGNQKWCLSGVCSADSSAPTGDDSCLYGDQLGPIFSNGWTCADMMVNAPSYCPHVHIACCGSCNPSTTSTSSTVMITSTTVQTPSTTLTDSATSMAPTTNNISQPPDTDAQCESNLGAGSFMCRGQYGGDFTSICTTLWCAKPTNTSICQSATATDGTVCGNQKWCLSGVCSADSSAPTGDDSCLYGDQLGPIFSNGWTCADMMVNAPSYCPHVHIACCGSCNPSTTSTSSTVMITSTTVQTPSTTLTDSATTMAPTTNNISQPPDADAQCESNLGAGSFMCRGQYGGDFTSICTTLWCAKPTNTSICQSATATDGTVCGNQKWCLSGVCSADSSAPTGDDSCLYGDQLGPIFTNGWTCADMMANAPSYCPHVHIACCGSCNPSTTSTSSTVMITSTTVQTPSTTLTDSATSMAPTTNNISQPPDADTQCESNLGAGSFLCRGQYGGDFTSICTTLWCAKPTNTSICQSATATDGTVCGNQKWCLSGVCSADSNAPTGDDSCLYGDRLGTIFSNGWTCADMMVNAPSYCPHVHIDCCGSCNPSTTSTSSTVMITSTAVQTPSTTLTHSATSIEPTTINISQPPTGSITTTTSPTTTTTSPTTTTTVPTTTTTSLTTSTTVPTTTTTSQTTTTTVPTTTTTGPTTTTTVPTTTTTGPTTTTTVPTTITTSPTTTTTVPTTTTTGPTTTTTVPTTTTTSPTTSTTVPTTTTTSQTTITTVPTTTTTGPTTFTTVPTSTTISPTTTTTVPTTTTTGPTITKTVPTTTTTGLTTTTTVPTTTTTSPTTTTTVPTTTITSPTTTTTVPTTTTTGPTTTTTVPTTTTTGPTTTTTVPTTTTTSPTTTTTVPTTTSTSPTTTTTVPTPTTTSPTTTTTVPTTTTTGPTTTTTVPTTTTTSQTTTTTVPTTTTTGPTTTTTVPTTTSASLTTTTTVPTTTTTSPTTTTTVQTTTTTSPTTTTTVPTTTTTSPTTTITVPTTTTTGPTTTTTVPTTTTTGPTTTTTVPTTTTTGPTTTTTVPITTTTSPTTTTTVPTTTTTSPTTTTTVPTTTTTSPTTTTTVPTTTTTGPTTTTTVPTTTTTGQTTTTTVPTTTTTSPTTTTTVPTTTTTSPTTTTTVPTTTSTSPTTTTTVPTPTTTSPTATTTVPTTTTTSPTTTTTVPTTTTTGPTTTTTVPTTTTTSQTTTTTVPTTTTTGPTTTTTVPTTTSTSLTTTTTVPTTTTTSPTTTTTVQTTTTTSPTTTTTVPTTTTTSPTTTITVPTTTTTGPTTTTTVPTTTTTGPTTTTTVPTTTTTSPTTTTTVPTTTTTSPTTTTTVQTTTTTSPTTTTTVPTTTTTVKTTTLSATITGTTLANLNFDSGTTSCYRKDAYITFALSSMFLAVIL